MANFIEFNNIDLSYTDGLEETIKKFGEDIEAGFPNVKASFERIKYAYEEPKQSWAEISKILTSNPIKETVFREEKTIENDKTKINPLPSKKFKFLVYNNTSYYRVFDIEIGGMYPVTISGYNTNIFEEKEIECHSEDSVINYLKQIFMNDLVIDILKRLNDC